MRRVCLMLMALTLYAGVVLAQSEGLEALRQQGYVRVCADPANMPFTSTDAATPGFEVELARLIARELGVEARLEWHATLARALQPLRVGRCDLFMGLPAEARFTEGNPWLSVSRPYYTMRHAVVAKAATGIAALDDLKGKRVAVDAISVADFTCLTRASNGVSTEARRRRFALSSLAKPPLRCSGCRWRTGWCATTPRCALSLSLTRVWSFRSGLGYGVVIATSP
jgi:membrane-bound lytic murein transglycosylase MltF